MITYGIKLVVDEGSVPALSSEQAKEIIRGKEVWCGNFYYYRQGENVYEADFFTGHTAAAIRLIGKVVEL